jgi:hypothetical protein
LPDAGTILDTVKPPADGGRVFMTAWAANERPSGATGNRP